MATPRQPLASARGMKRLSKILQTAIKIVAGLLGLYYGFLALMDAPFDRMTQAFDASSLIRLGLFLFFFGWLSGASDDTTIQSDVFEIDPQEGKLGLSEIAGIIGFLLVFVALFQLNDRPILFQSVLLAFICTNVATVFVIMRRTRPIYRENADLFLKRGDHGAYLKLAIVSDYMNGNWQRLRFMVLVGLAAGQVLVAALVASGALGRAIGGLTIKGIPGAVLVNYIPGLFFIVYVVVSELWMKIYRIKVKSDMVTIDYIEMHYTIAKRRGTMPPELNLRDPWDRTEPANENYL